MFIQQDTPFHVYSAGTVSKRSMIRHQPQLHLVNNVAWCDQYADGCVSLLLKGSISHQESKQILFNVQLRNSSHASLGIDLLGCILLQEWLAQPFVSCHCTLKFKLQWIVTDTLVKSSSESLDWNEALPIPQPSVSHCCTHHNPDYCPN